MLDKLTKKAKKLFLSKKYEQVIELLKSHIAHYNDDFDFFYYLGFAYFFTGDFTKAYTHLKTAQLLSKDDINILLGIAVIFLKRKNYERAIETWLSVLDKQKNNRQAKYAIKFFANVDFDNMNFNALEKSGKLKRLYPKFPIYIPPLTYYVIFAIALTSVTIFFAPSIIKKIQNSMIEYRKGIEKIYDLQGKMTFSETEDYAIYKYNPKELNGLIDEIMLNFSKKRDNAVRLGVNRILLSNADYSSKEKVKSIIEYLNVPDFTNFAESDSYDYKDIEKEPLLYNGVYTRWKGSIANLVKHEKYMSFDFLLGYEEHKLVIAQIPTIFSFPVDIDNGDSIEMIAKVGLNGESGIKLDGASVRKLRKNAPIKETNAQSSSNSQEEPQEDKSQEESQENKLQDETQDTQSQQSPAKDKK